jgi:hypothetical protein
MQEAEPTGEHPGGGEEVHVVAEVEGTRREGEAWMAVDDAQRTLRWGSEGPNSYHGELQVAPAASGAEVAGSGQASNRRWLRSSRRSKARRPTNADARGHAAPTLR